MARFAGQAEVGTRWQRLDLAGVSHPDSASAEAARVINVNKRELCRILGCAATTLDALIARYEAFPIVERGSHGRDFAFDPDAVVAFLRAAKEQRQREDADRAAELRQLDLPVAGLIGTHPTATYPKPQDRLAVLRAQQLERQIARETGQLIEVSEVRRVFASQMQRWGIAQTQMLQRCARNFNLPDAVIRGLVSALDDARKRFVEDLQRQMPQPPASDELFPNSHQPTPPASARDGHADAA